jgi:hypothetical protein
MTEETLTKEAVTELDVLKTRAKLMGILFSNNIGIEALKEKIDAKLSGETDKPAEALVLEVNPLAKTVDVLKTPSLRDWLIAEEMKLIRVRITNLDPKKKDLSGEIITVANEYLGTVRKYIPFGEVTENGYHIPKCLFTLLQARQFLNVRTKKNSVNGSITVETSWAKEFALDVLDPLTPDELQRLAMTQSSTRSVEND